ncbi:glycosyltransferase family 9 protein [Sphingomonas sp. DT-207]|uniref:glycosyltransferase family 9 protein n=1 Tax=Sphingomonas sp. DT-207 TaxID=3396167 RepID=UPI003F1B384A
MTDRMGTWAAAMRAERYADAWAVAARTLAERDPGTRDDPALPYHLRWVWDGRSFDNRHVLVRCYHGLGDTLQFARFLPKLAERAASLTVEAQPRLIDLVTTVAEGIALVPFDVEHPLPASEVDIEITELDFALRATPRDAPPPYLRAPRAVLPKGTIALCYGAGDWDGERCVPPALFASLCRHAPCVTLVPEPTGLDVLNPGGCPFDIGATAALVAGSELVITVDTMIAHLAGAMDKPVWLLLKADPDWRWAADRPGSPWYPSIRPYVQPRPGDWESVLASVERDLASGNLVAAER